MISPTAIDGVLVGHWTDGEAATGCTVVLCPPGTRAAVDVRGPAPGTRETDLLGPGRLVREIHAILLAGGSAFGLDAAAGVMRYLEQTGRGFDTGVARVPIVPAAVIFDLGVGSADRRPGPDEGFAACQAATSQPVAEGCVGAGTGATVGKYRGGGWSMMGGVGVSGQRLDGGVIVSALAVVNAAGDIIGDDGTIIAGARDPDTGQPTGFGGVLSGVGWGSNTVLVVVVTNASHGRDDLIRFCSAAHDGFARSIYPAHTLYDGDVAFCLSAGERPSLPPVIGEAVVSVVVADAIRRAVRMAQGRDGIPAAVDL